MALLLVGKGGFLGIRSEEAGGKVRWGEFGISWMGMGGVFLKGGCLEVEKRGIARHQKKPRKTASEVIYNSLVFLSRSSIHFLFDISPSHTLRKMLKTQVSTFCRSPPPDLSQPPTPPSRRGPSRTGTELSGPLCHLPRRPSPSSSPTRPARQR